MKQKEWDILKQSPEYKLWRATIYKRDSWKCRECNSTEKIEAHHIIPLRTDFNKRFEISNGITLCMKCHRLIFGKELELVEYFTGLIEKNSVNSGKLLPDNAGDNPEPSIKGNLNEGATTRSRGYTLEQFINKQIPCASCGKILIRHNYRAKRNKNSFCNNLCRSKYLKNKMPPWYKGELKQFCLNCNKKTLTPSDTRRIKKYCNNVCQNEFQRKLKQASNTSTSALPERDDIV